MSNVKHDLTNIESLLHESRPEINNDELRMSDGERMTLGRCRDLLKREPLVQEVIGKLRSYDLHGFDASDRAALIAAVRKLAEWKP